MARKFKRVLQWVNRIRKKEFGKGPLKQIKRGRPDDQTACAIHNCFVRSGDTSVSVDYDCVYRQEHEDIDTPYYVSRFISDFDKGKYPELVNK